MSAHVWQEALLSRAAIDRIIGSTGLEVVGAEIEARCRRVLNNIAGRLPYQAYNRARLSRRAHLRPMLTWWKRWRETGTDAARAKLGDAVNAARNHARYPIPCPFDHPEQFERWLADESLGLDIEPALLRDCLSVGAMEGAEGKAQRIHESARATRLLSESPLWVDRSRDLSSGGRLNDREADHRLEMLLAVFWILFGERPNDSVAIKRPRGPRDNSRDATRADGGAAARFVAVFEAECEAAINAAQITDPTRPRRPRVRRWKKRTLSAIAQHIDALSQQRGECWEVWAIIGDGADAMLVRTQIVVEAERA